MLERSLEPDYMLFVVWVGVFQLVQNLRLLLTGPVPNSHQNLSVETLTRHEETDIDS